MAAQGLQEPSFEDLKARLFALPVNERRVALSLIGNAIGDSLGLPFECKPGWHPAVDLFHSLKTASARKKYTEYLLQDRLMNLPFREVEVDKNGGLFLRTWSDDTTCCDLKMSAIAHANFLLQANHEKDVKDTLLRALYQQYLKWAHTAGGSFFQGTGGFTEDFLRPRFRGRLNNAIARVMQDKPLFQGHFGYNGKNSDLAEFIVDAESVHGPFWPTPEFVVFAQDYFAGKHGFPSWGNGAAMSFAPDPALASRWRSPESPRSELCGAAALLSETHLEAGAVLGSKLQRQLLEEIYAGRVASTADLKSTVKKLPVLTELMVYDHDCYPLAAFWEWLDSGDCAAATAEAFLQRMSSRSEQKFDLSVAPHGIFGAMLHLAGTYEHTDYSFVKCEKRIEPCRPGSKEPIMFSHRGLNTVIVGIFASAGAASLWEAFDRVIYAGGDTDTVGACAGQIACPLFDAADVIALFSDFAACSPSSTADSEEAREAQIKLRDALGWASEPTAPPDLLAVANAAARRYFNRCLLFASGDLETLEGYASLLDPDYAGITSCL